MLFVQGAILIAPIQQALTNREKDWMDARPTATGQVLCPQQSDDLAGQMENIPLPNWMKSRL